MDGLLPCVRGLCSERRDSVSSEENSRNVELDEGRVGNPPPVGVGGREAMAKRPVFFWRWGRKTRRTMRARRKRPRMDEPGWEEED